MDLISEPGRPIIDVVVDWQMGRKTGLAVLVEYSSPAAQRSATRRPQEWVGQEAQPEVARAPAAQLA